jgi:hypothetical protein
VARPVPRQAGWPEPGVDAGGEVHQGRFPARIEAGANRQRLVAGDELRIPQRPGLVLDARSTRSSVWLPAIRPPVGLVKRLGRPS